MTRTRRACLAALVLLLAAGAITWSTRQGGLRWDELVARAGGAARRSPGAPDDAGARPAPVSGLAPRPPSPLEARRFQAVYAVPSDRAPAPGRAEALTHEVRLVRDWFAGQLPGGAPRFAADGADIEVVTATLPWTAPAIAGGEVSADRIAAWLAEHDVIGGPVVPIVFLDGAAHDEGSACAWASVDAVDRTRTPLRTRARYVLVPMENCTIFPEIDSIWPEGTSYVVAHEATHALGGADERAPHHTAHSHTSEDARDIIFQPGENQGRDWDHLMLDPGHDDYLGHGRADLVDIRDSELIIRPPT